MGININDLQTIEVPLSQLFAWEGNVRNIEADEREGPDDGDIAELAASIAAVGLLSTPVVQKSQRRKYAVIGGGRRLRALKKLAAEGAIKPSYPVTCRLAPDGADPVELGLAENLHQPMHPAAQFIAFKRLCDNGKSIADIAASFGVTEAVVSRRLALARVSPLLLAKYRAGDSTWNCCRRSPSAKTTPRRKRYGNNCRPIIGSRTRYAVCFWPVICQPRID